MGKMLTDKFANHGSVEVLGTFALVPPKLQDFQYVKYTREGEVARLTLDRPEHNLLNERMLSELAAGIIAMGDSREIKLIILDSASKAFCGGIELGEYTQRRVFQLLDAFHQAFAAMLETGGVYEVVSESGAAAVVVEGDDLPDRLAERSMERLRTLVAVVVAVVTDPTARLPDWADVVVGADGTTLAAVLATVGDSPMASTTLAVLLRTGHHRSVAEGLVAESMAYGLLQGGPEFARWRAGHPARVRPEPAGAPVRVSRDDQVLSITLDRPHVRNAFNAAMRDELVAALEVAVADPTATVVLRGSGESFCSGGDLDEFGSRPDPVTAHLVRLSRNAGRAVADVADRTTVHIHGSTVGSGIELAAFAHRVVAHPDTRIALPEVRLGLIPGAGGTFSLPRRIGRHATMLLAVGLPSIDAETALDWGLVDEIED